MTACVSSSLCPLPCPLIVFPMARKNSWADSTDTAIHVVGIMWLVFLAEILLPFDLRAQGIRPRSMTGLWGILFCPFLHANLTHLAANSVALFVLLVLSLSFSRRLTTVASAFILLIGGGLVWCLGRVNTVHIGASGWIFGLIGFLITAGAVRKEWRALVFSLLVLVLYGGTLHALLHSEPGISWISHAGGFVAGVLSAWWTRKKT